MKTPLEMEMYYVRKYTSTCRFLKIVNTTFTGLVDFFYESTVEVYCPLCTLCDQTNWHMLIKSIYNKPNPYLFSNNYCEVISG